MNSGLVSFIRGYVKIAVAGEPFEPFINRLIERNYRVWDIRRIGEGKAELYVVLSDFFRLKPHLKQTGLRIRVLERHGLPFFLDKLDRRKWFMAGAAAFLIGLYLLSSIVWNIEVSGNDTIPEDRILNAARSEGLFLHQWKWKLKDRSELSQRLSKAVPNVAWIGVEIQGTTVRIQVVESTVPKKREPRNPRHIVASSDAVITRILAETGVPQVGVNTRVRKGDILISGILGDDQNRKVVVADGDVRGLVWYEYTVQSPLERKHTVLTGERQSRWYLVIGNRALQLTGYGQEAYKQEKMTSERSRLQWRDWLLPVGWLHETYQEARIVNEKVSQNEAREAGLRNARADLLSKVGTKAVIRDQKILHERVDNGKVVLKVLFEAEVDIAAERPILEQELQPPEEKSP
ncbi:sporulation protein YqfD [Paenibacillus alkalitolerans]|uniref:sporulation protein YqfD n=1 Tax=Paenibacillus alkalitolerans TaxID=2799335 RepID=UPI0018F4D1CD|nr:sporulation protein YqfD [Paenibacillus alkalitolerans]